MEFAGVTEADTVFDIGCGDGRVLVAAAREKGAKVLHIFLDCYILFRLYYIAF
jgi:cyclopropane fatty-acyl-phospholipid synthase-like methyltransferase